MKKFNFLTAIMLAFVANHSQAQISDVIASEMHGKVKSCTFYNSKFSHEEGDEYIFEEADVTLAAVTPTRTHTQTASSH